MPLAPLDGPAKVTDAPEIGLLHVSVTEATRGLANAVLMIAVWPEPETIAAHGGAARADRDRARAARQRRRGRSRRQHVRARNREQSPSTSSSPHHS